MRSLAILLVTLFFVHLATSRCNPNIVKKIEALNLNNENFLNTTVGEYKFAFLSVGNLKGKRSGPCIRLRFFKEEDTYKIEFVGAMNGTYKAEMENGKIQMTGPGGNLDMVAYIVANGPDVISFHICSDLPESQGPSLSLIAVSVIAKNPEDNYNMAKKTLEEVGIQTGIEMKCCISGDGGPIGGDNLNDNNSGDIVLTEEDDDLNELSESHDEVEQERKLAQEYGHKLEHEHELED